MDKLVLRASASHDGSEAQRWIAYVHNNKLLQTVHSEQQEMFEMGMTAFEDVLFVDIKLAHFPVVADLLFNCTEETEPLLVRAITVISQNRPNVNVLVTLLSKDGHPVTDGYTSEDGKHVVKRFHYDQSVYHLKWGYYIDGVLVAANAYRNDMVEECNIKLSIEK